jgi:hypothetical protein
LRISEPIIDPIAIPIGAITPRIVFLKLATFLSQSNCVSKTWPIYEVSLRAIPL